MLHTLGSAVVDIVRSVDTYEWGKLTEVERWAIGVFHKTLGDAMEKPFTLRPSCKVGRTDGIYFARESFDWTLEYEKKAAKPTESTRVLGNICKLCLESMVLCLSNSHEKKCGSPKEIPNRAIVHRLLCFSTVPPVSLRTVCPTFVTNTCDEPILSAYNERLEHNLTEICNVEQCRNQQMSDHFYQIIQRSYHNEFGTKSVWWR